MAEVNVRGAKLELRTVNLSQKLLKQLRSIAWASIPKEWILQDGTLDDTRVIGWIAPTVFQDEFGMRRLLLNNGKGDCYLLQVDESTAKKFKQLYIS